MNGRGRSSVTTGAAFAMPLLMYFAYLEIKNPNIRSDPHQRLMEILSYSFGETNSTTGGSGGSGQVNMHDVSIVRNADFASGKLWQACSNGTHFDEVIITVYKDDSAAAKPSVTYTLRLCMLASLTDQSAA